MAPPRALPLMSLYIHVPKSHQMEEFGGTKVVESVPTTFIAALLAPMAKSLNAAEGDGGRAVRY